MKAFVKRPSPRKKGLAALTAAAFVGASLIATAPAAFASDELGEAVDATDLISAPEVQALELAPFDSTASGFVVDSLTMGAGAADANPGDGICATTDGDCTFLAALQEVNATTGTDAIAITFDDALGAGQIVMSDGFAQRMSTETLGHASVGTFGQFGAYFEVNSTVPVTIDFGGDADVAGLLITSDNVTVLNSPDNRAGAAAYVVRGANATLENLAVDDAGAIILEVGIGLMTGADSVTITNFAANSIWHSGIAIGEGEVVTGVTIDRFAASDVGGGTTIPF